MILKTDRAKITVKKDLRTNKYKISTEYESDELDNIN